jgi:beta-phosphoglucomutase-like phosphatase (HAD superfamily)
MFWDPPADYEPSPAERDMRARWKPSPDQDRAAAKLLAANPRAYGVIVALALPGKAHGIWTVGQPVEHPEGAWLVKDRREDYHRARDEAERAADRHLGDRAGEASYSIITRDECAATFEGFRPYLGDKKGGF